MNAYRERIGLLSAALVKQAAMLDADGFGQEAEQLGVRAIALRVIPPSVLHRPPQRREVASDQRGFNA